ncbi:response regulator transcription factor [Roseateles sp.]|jgi:two-component system OmpR family response regulator|uniref:response regulator transcription factor n=1 Tax=Roseateles sp. TaxID=1971397 RepID=UPI0037CA3770
MRLLLIEDDPILGEGLRDFLRSDGHLVDWVSRLADARALVDEPYDAMLVDWQLPDGSGLDWIRGLRQRGSVTPVLMLTARDQLGDRVRGLDSGADDYLVKPFEPEELSARLRAVCRRSGGGASTVRQIGELQLDLLAKTVSRAGHRVDLTAREWRLLEALLQRAGRVVSKPDLEALVMGFEGDVSSNVLEVHVSNLRRKLGASLIETVRGLGYRLNA